MGPLAATLALALAASAAPQAKPKPDAAKSIEAGIAWLARHQNPDGSWGGNSLAQRCTGERKCFDDRAALSGHFDEGLTGLAVLCLVRAGVFEKTPPKLVDRPTGEAVDAAAAARSGLAWLRKIQRKNGSFCRDRSHVYIEAAACLAMIEGSEASGDESWAASAAKGVEFIQKAQRRSPTSDEKLWGWRYATRQDVEVPPKAMTPDQEEAWQRELHDADVSATGWAVAVLEAGARAKLPVDEAALEGALDYLNFATNTKGQVGYTDSDTAGTKVTGPFDDYDYHFGTMSAIGILIRSSTSGDTTNAFYDLAAKEVLRDLPVPREGLSVDYYYWYHGTAALNRLEGTVGAKKAKRKVADPWNKAVLESLSALQDRAKDGCSSGGWIVPDRWNLYAGGPVYSTTMGVLALQAIGKKK